jgi:thymidylate synthase
MKQYYELLQNVIDNGEVRSDRTGEGTKSIFGGQLSFDLRERFPLVTIKKTLWRSAFIEMLWFLRGEPNTAFLKANNVPIWDDWADEQGNLGPVYGVQWRAWKKQDGTTIDQIKKLIVDLKNNKTSRRHIVTAWNPAELDQMGLPPCHRDFQCYVSNDGYLDLMWSQRSWDLGLGAPFNIAQYAFLTHLLAQCAGLKPRYLKVNYGDAHLYLNHIEKMQAVLANCKPIDDNAKLIIKTANTDIDSFDINDFDIDGYQSHAFVKLPIAV